jgi:hypothetical protein
MSYPRFPRICERCGAPFLATPDQVKRNWGRFCSKLCSIANYHDTHPPKTQEERFWAKVIKTDVCWNWTGAKNPKGYGILHRSGKQARNILAHRVSWELHNGPIPEGMWVLHRCDNPECTRPDHLFLGTVIENMQDAAQKCRIKGKRKLTVDQAQEIRSRYATGMFSFTQLAREYHVCYQRIAAIVRNQSYRIPVSHGTSDISSGSLRL